MLKQLIIHSVATVALILVPCENVSAQSAREIMERTLSKSSWNDMKADMMLVLKNAQGKERVREIAFYSSDDAAGLDRMLMKFVSPADVKGTGFLTLEKAIGNEERYLYLPALRRVRKIAASGSGGNFMSSDFTYYDIGEPKIDDWTYILDGEAEYKGRPHFKIKCTPATTKIKKDTGYGQIIRYVDMETYSIPFSEIYDVGLKKWKTMEVLEFEVLKGVEFATHMVVHDLDTGHSSSMRFNNLQVDTSIPDQYFSVRYLQRGR